MKHLTYLTVFTLLFAVQSISSTAFAQRGQQCGQQRRQQCLQQNTRSGAKLNTFKFKCIINMLNLSKADSVEFKGIYDAYRSEIDATIKKSPNGNSVECMRLLSDKELTAAMLTNFKNMSAISDIKAEYITKFAKVLTARQIQMVYTAEGTFSQRLKQASQRRMGKGKRNGMGKCNGMGNGNRGTSSNRSQGHL